jgi:hypothetical protein
MSNLSPNKTDKFFRQALKKGPDLSPSEKDWIEMERLLKGKPKKRPVIGWIYWPAGIAAGLLVFLTLWLTREQEVRLADGEKVENSIKENQNTYKKTENTLSAISKPDPINTDDKKSSFFNEVLVKQDKKNLPKAFSESPATININPEIIQESQLLNNALFLEPKNISKLTSLDLSLVKNLTLKAGNLAALDTGSKKANKKIEKPTGRMSLSMAFTTDMNTVSGIGNSKAGLSGGFGINYRISKVISAGTGIYYSQKQYSSDRNSYNTAEKPFATWASYSRQIDADCRVIDIPLNMNVLVSKTPKTGIVASAGLSSYIMLSENYNFIYTPTILYPSGGRDYTIKNQNQHILSVVNLSVGVEKPIGNQTSMVIQPYAKLPISGIGQGNTELKSFGIGFQLNYSMKKKNKFFNRQPE